MSNVQVTNQMRQFLSATRATVEAAEHTYNTEGAILEQQSRHTTSSLSDMSGAVRLLTRARELTRTMYNAYEAAVQSLDALCRPLLTQGPSDDMVRQVSEYIAHLNHEASTLGENISASYGAQSFGQVGAVRYVSSVDAKAIEAFWQATYDATPEAREYARIRAERATKAEADHNAALFAKQEADRLLREQFAPVTSRRDALAERCRSAVQAYRDQCLALLADLRPMLLPRAAAAREALVQKIRDMVAERKSLGVFRIKEKNQLFQEITREQLRLDAFDPAKAAEQWATEAESAIRAAVKDYESLMDAHIGQCYPVAAQHPLSAPAPTEGTAIQRQNEIAKAAILATLIQENRPMAVSDVMETCREAGDLSSQRVSALLRQLVTDGTVDRSAEGRIAFFAANGKPASFGFITEYRENAALAESPLPVPAKTPEAVLADAPFHAF